MCSEPAIERRGPHASQSLNAVCAQQFDGAVQYARAPHDPVFTLRNPLYRSSFRRPRKFRANGQFPAYAARPP
jgi:hypothetical protein